MVRDSSIEGAILLAEDEPSIRYTLTAILQQAGYSVRAVSSFAAARSELLRNSYDALVADIGFEKDELGLVLAREAKQLKPPPAVVMYSDNPTVAQMRAALALEVDYFAFRPVDIEEIKSALFRLIARRSVFLALA